MLNKKQRTAWQTTSIAIAALVVFPLATLFVLSFDGIINGNADVWSHLSNTVLSDYVTGSLSLMAGVALLTLALGIGSAWLVTQYDFAGVRIFNWALLLPLAMPTYITAYSYTGLLDVAGPVQSLIRDSFKIHFVSHELTSYELTNHHTQLCEPFFSFCSCYSPHVPPPILRP